VQIDLGESDELKSEINVTPLVDVMLVLLVIFMVVTPLLRRQLPVELPIAEHAANPSSPKQVTLTAAADGRLVLDDEPVDDGALAERLRALFATRAEKTIFLAADRTLPYSRVVDLMDTCRAAGIERIGVVTRNADPAR
jgi:biopolymer transport protein ExbD